MYQPDHDGNWTRPKFDVLIVEDEPVSRKALVALVTARGYRTDSVSSAEDALKRVAQTGMPRIALVDLDLPGMSGIELIKQIEALDPCVFPVLITAAASELVAEIRRRYPVAYLQKPLDFEGLMKLLSGRKALN